MPRPFWNDHVGTGLVNAERLFGLVDPQHEIDIAGIRNDVYFRDGVAD